MKLTEEDKKRIIELRKQGLGYRTIAKRFKIQLIAKRYEKSSTIVTTNKPLSKWGEIFGDSVIANAILDRLLHHSHVINIVGRSYRTKNVLDELEDSN